MPTSSEPKQQKLLLLVTELKPFLQLSSISLFLHRLLIQLDKQGGSEIRVILPKFGVINERINSLHSVQRLSGINIAVEGEEISLIVKVAALRPTRVRIYFLDNEYLFDRKGVFNDKEGNPYPDNHHRIIFLNKAVLMVLNHLQWHPTIVHSFGWPWIFFPKYATIGRKHSLARDTHYLYTHDETEISEATLLKVEKSMKESGETQSAEPLYKRYHEYTEEIFPIKEPSLIAKGEEAYGQELIQDALARYEKMGLIGAKKTTSSPGDQYPKFAYPS